MKTALVSGSLGFIGRHFCAALNSAGYAVTGLDILDGKDAREFFRFSHQPYDLVIHAAAVGADRASIDGNPLSLAANLELDAGLFQWAARVHPGRVVYFSSSAAYPVLLQTGNPEHKLAEGNINPRWPCAPDAIYGSIKLTGEMLAARARDAGVSVSVCRPFSGYAEDQGGRFPFGALAARAARREDPFAIWGTGGQTRDFIHVDDIVNAVMAMVIQGIDGPVNLGTGRPTMMVQLAGMMCETAGYPQVTVEAHPEKPSGVAYRVADVTLMNQFYTAKITLEEGVARAMRHLVSA